MNRRKLFGKLAGIAAGAVGGSLLRVDTDPRPMIKDYTIETPEYNIVVRKNDIRFEETFEQLQKRLKNLKHVHVAMGLRSKTSV